MAKKWLTAALLLVLALNACTMFRPPDASLCKAWWIGEVDLAFIEEVRRDIARVEANGCKHMTAELVSPGGFVTAGIEVIRQIRAAESRGLIVEIQGGAMVASMAVIVLAAGTPRYRYVDPNALVVVHGISRASGPFGETTCVGVPESPTTEDDKVTQQLAYTMANLLAEFTGQPFAVTLDWLKCGNEQVGTGELLVKLGIADATRP